MFDPNRQAVTSDRREVQLIEDSEDVRRWIQRQSALRAKERSEVDKYLRDLMMLLNRGDKYRADQLVRNPELYIPERIAFLNALDKAPAFKVAAHSYCRILQRSAAVCSRHPQENPYFVKVRITSGSDRGREGWGCLGDGIGFTTAWP